MFYGWVVVLAAFSVLAIAYALQFSYGVFLPHIAADLGWERSDLSAPYALFVLVYTALSLVTGRFTDRLGPRLVISLGAIGLTLGYAVLGTINERWEPYLWLGLVAAIGSSVAFVPCNATVIKWFVRRRGLALGLASCGVSAAAVLGPAVAAPLIETLGWRHALQVLALGGGVAMIIAAQAMVASPEARGLTPDASARPLAGAPTGAPTGPPRSEAEDHTLSQAWRTRAFWLLSACLMFTWLVVFVPFVHLAAYGLDLGLHGFEAATLLSAIGIGGLAGRLISGGLTDRFGRIPGLVIALTLQALAFLGFAASQDFTWLLAWALAYGFGYSGVSVLFPALLGDFFGRTHAGTIAGFVFGTVGAAAAAGPYVAGVLYDTTGSYDVAFVIASISNSLALFLLAFLRPPSTAGGRR